MSDFSEDVFFFQRFHKRLFKLIRSQIAALGVRTDLQGVRNNSVLLSHKIPEVTLVGITAPAGLVFLGLHRVCHHRTAGRLVKLHVHVPLAFQAVDFFSKIDDFLFHLFVGGRVFC